MIERILALLEGSDPAPASDWLSWFPVMLCRQRARQTWLMEQWESLYELEDLGGDVPHLAEWQYEFHGRGLCLQGPGETIDVDAYPDPVPGMTIDPIFCWGRLKSLGSPGLPEQRVLERVPEHRTFLAALRSCRARGWITHPESDHVFHLHPELEALHEEVAAVDFDDPTVARRWAAALGGDDSSFTAWVLHSLEDRRNSGLLLELGPRLDPGLLREQTDRVLLGPIDTATGHALQALRQSGQAPGDLHTDLIERFQPDEHHPFAVCELARWLLEHDIARKRVVDLVEAFARVDKVRGYIGNPMIDRLTGLLLAHAPERARPFARRGLSSSIPLSWRRTAVQLSVVDEPWSRQELLDAARASEDIDRRSFLAACLTFSQHAPTRDLAKDLAPIRPSLRDHIGQIRRNPRPWDLALL